MMHFINFCISESSERIEVILSLVLQKCIEISLRGSVLAVDHENLFHLASDYCQVFPCVMHVLF